MTPQEQITLIENHIEQCRNKMQFVLNSEGVNIPEHLQGTSLEEWSHWRSAYAILIEHLRHIESAMNTAIGFINNNLS